MNFVTLKIGSWSHFACECDNCSKIITITFKLYKGVTGTKISDKFDIDLSVTIVTLKIRSQSIQVKVNFACECQNCSKIMAITFKLNRGVPGTKISEKFDNDLCDLCNLEKQVRTNFASCFHIKNNQSRNGNTQFVHYGVLAMKTLVARECL